MAKHCLIDAAMAKPLLLVFFFIFSLFSIALLPHTAARTARTAADWPAFILDSWGSFVARSLQTTVTTKPSWCIAKTSIDDSTMQAALDYACGQTTADCEPIKFGGPCFFPNTVEDHASYVFNSYYQVNAKGSSTCNFGGAAMVTTTNPSTLFSESIWLMVFPSYKRYIWPTLLSGCSRAWLPTPSFAF